ncbi:hypothetical protein PYV02_04500 [Leifsonia sp. H3M29-4]|uniref:hypothetical protein n=1 Tax=Salinibacterium metalliresistens TaxID=3031321 RepID=UPI0023DC5B63|nr:hypothetical protein [Salinibacterium metalliresistens]MDF1478338.1 hypothetical protein [Salinibacterium metalliresistens]
MARPMSALRAAFAGVMLAGTVAACSSAPIDAVHLPGSGEVVPGAPAECAGSFPFSIGPATLDDLGLLPADWPAPPEGSVLCATTHTNGGLTETADFVTELAPGGVLAHYTSALPARARLERTVDATLVGSIGAVSFEIRPDEGRFTIVITGTNR